MLGSTIRDLKNTIKEAKNLMENEGGAAMSELYENTEDGGE